MKPITLSPAQLDAALAVAPVRHMSPLQVDHVRNVLTVTAPGRCPEAWHRDSTTGLEYGRCRKLAGHAGNHTSRAGTRWDAVTNKTLPSKPRRKPRRGPR
jgi:hypothetical protein